MLAPIGGCTIENSTSSSTITPVAGPASAASELEFVQALVSTSRVTWSDLLAGALVLTGRAYAPATDPAAQIAQARAAGLLSAVQPDPDPAGVVTLLDVAGVATRALGTPADDDAAVRLAITRLDAMGIWPPGTQPGWDATGEQVSSVLAAVSDELVNRPAAAGAGK